MDHFFRKQKSFVVDPAVFTCISMLAKAIGPGMKKDVQELLDSMLATGLSPALTASLRDLANQIPQLKKEIQDGLLKNLSMILMGKPLRHPGAPKSPSTSVAQTGTVIKPIYIETISCSFQLYTAPRN